METQGAIYENAARLHEAGVTFAITTASAHNVRNLPYEAGLAVTYGLPHDVALRAVTVHPAEILGLADRLGTLESGKDADLIVVDGDPFQPLTNIEHVIIGGRDVPLESHHTRLAEKYSGK
jgi:imidazolonepropionase-like amidohydrolase